MRPSSSLRYDFSSGRRVWRGSEYLENIDARDAGRTLCGPAPTALVRSGTWPMQLCSGNAVQQNQTHQEEYNGHAGVIRCSRIE